MFSDHDNPVSAAAAAPAHDAQSAETPKETSQATPQENPTEQQHVAAREQATAEQNAVHETPSQRTEEDPKAETSPELPADRAIRGAGRPGAGLSRAAARNLRGRHDHAQDRA